MLIPHKALSPEALEGIIEEFVTRDGTDYGDWEIDLRTKKAQVRKLLDQGIIAIVFDAQEDGVNLIEKEKLPSAFLDESPTE